MLHGTLRVVGVKVTDPVCGMSVRTATAAACVEHETHAYYFCGKGCAATFTANPDKYTKLVKG